MLGFLSMLRRRGSSSSGAPVAVTWDPAQIDEAIGALSNGNLTFTTTQEALYASCRSTTSRSTGKYAIEATFNYPSDAEFGEIAFGAATAVWDDPLDSQSDEFLGSESTGYSLVPDGGMYLGDGNYVVGDKTVADGGKARLKIDLDDGKGWFGNESGFNGDPEAGTDPDFTFTPNTPLYIGATLYSFDEPSPTSIVLNPTYTDGSFGAWES